MTGNLNAPLNTNPPFPGKERHYLRAQIARISHACTLAPTGLYGDSGDENQKEPVVQEEFTMPAIGELNAENWVHHYPYILKAGRTAHLPPAGIPEEEVDAAIQEMEEKDPNID